MKSKILFFSVFLFFLAVNSGCGDKFNAKAGDDHIIPYTPVYTEIPLGAGGEDRLSWNGNAKYFEISTPNPKPLGYRGHGIIVYTSDADSDDFSCFDATCTNCSDLESHFTQKDIRGAVAICPVCRTEFALNAGGYAFDNTEKIYPLKSYPVEKRGNRLIISY